MLSSCSSRRKEYEKFVDEWMEKEIVFPDSMKLDNGLFTTCPDTEFKIISYFDSVGCTGCKLRLPYWNEFMSKTDSIVGQGKLSLMIVVNTHNLDGIKKLIKESGFVYNIFLDEDSLLYKINNFPEQPELRTFLLDRSNQVILIGNPTLSKSVENLYLSQISSNITMTENNTETPVYNHDFGKIKPGHKVYHVFNLKNESRDTLKVKKLITSCECTEGEISAQTIPPGEFYSVKVTFLDETPGEFERVVSIYFENNVPEVLFELTGEITTDKNI